MLTAGLRTLARLSPWAGRSDADLRRAVAFLGWNRESATDASAGNVTAETAGIDAETVTRAGHGSALVVATAGLPALAVLPPRLWGLVVVAAVILAVGVRRGLPAGVRLLATARRTSALGAAPDLVARAVLRMRLRPSPEAAAAFAAETGEGRLAASLRSHVRRAGGTPESALVRFGEEWGEQFPSLRHALAGIETAGNAHEHARERALDDALSVVLDGTRETAATFAATVRTPATALYAFGVLLPLTLVALLPAASATGLSVSVPLLVVGYDVALPVTVALVSAWLLARRPVAFPTVRVSRSHPSVPSTPRHAVAAGVAAAVVSGVVTAALWPPWAVPLAVVGCGVGTALFVEARPARSVKRRARSVESGLPDVLALVGRQVTRGRAVESALDVVADETDGETAAVFADAARRQRQLGDGVETALSGALATVPSVRARSVARLLVLAASEGRPAGDALVSMATHLRELQRVEAETRRTLANVTRTLSNTAAVFAPLVGGSTVALADAIGRVDVATGGSVPSTATIGLAVGAYVLVLSILLATLTAGLQRGFDRARVGYRVGVTLVSATVVFLVAIRAVGLFV
ncbi:MAG: type II secretion system F family protein [Haloarculaceae archaeon]